jgi:hypothetical protein
MIGCAQDRSMLDKYETWLMEDNLSILCLTKPEIEVDANVHYQPTAG